MAYSSNDFGPNYQPDAQWLMDTGAWSGAPPGWTQQGDSMINNNFQPQQPSNTLGSIGAGASGIGAILSLAPKLLGEAKQRAYAKKIAAIQAQQEREKYLESLTNMGYSEEDILHQAPEQQADFHAGMAARGMEHSSVNEQKLAELKYQQERGLDAIRRQRSRMKSGYAASLKIADLQKKAAKSAQMYDTIAQVTNAVGQAAGAAAAFSDKNLKENIKPVKNGAALEVVVATPVSEWNYKADPVNKHLGPMAQDVAKNAPEISDGKTIDLVSANGLLMQAVKDLADEVKALKASIGNSK